MVALQRVIAGLDYDTAWGGCGDGLMFVTQVRADLYFQVDGCVMLMLVLVLLRVNKIAPIINRVIELRWK